MFEARRSAVRAGMCMLQYIGSPCAGLGLGKARRQHCFPVFLFLGACICSLREWMPPNWASMPRRGCGVLSKRGSFANASLSRQRLSLSRQRLALPRQRSGSLSLASGAHSVASGSLSLARSLSLASGSLSHTLLPALTPSRHARPHPPRHRRRPPPSRPGSCHSAGAVSWARPASWPSWPGASCPPQYGVAPIDRRSRRAIASRTESGAP